VLAGLTYEQLRAKTQGGQGAPVGRADVLLGALWRLSRQDGDAGRVLLACLAPAARAVASAYWHSLGNEEAFAIAIAAMWDRIARFDPYEHYVAYRLKWLARRHVNKAATERREHRSHTRPLTDDVTAPIEPTGLPVLMLLSEAADVGAVTRRGAWLTWATHCEGLSLAQAAELAGIGYEAAKKSRQRAGKSLRGWLEEAA
jgi:DNA-directed RNA polymerase specialized sigma24 family protein